MVSLSLVSVTCNQLWPKNIKWKIPEINNSQVLNCNLFLIAKWNLGLCCSFPPRKWIIPLSSIYTSYEPPALESLIVVLFLFGERERENHIHINFSTVYCFNYSILLLFVNPLLCPIFKLSLIIGIYESTLPMCRYMYKKKYSLYNTICSFWHPLVVLELIPLDKWGTTVIFDWSFTVQCGDH